MSVLRRLFRRSASSRPAAPDARRQFLRRAGGLGLGALGVGLVLSDDAWAGVEARAERFGITPGAVVGPDGAPLSRAPLPSEPFIGEISIFGFNFAPRGWSTCDGQLLAISSNQALFSLLGTTYGGDGRTTFGLPDLRGRLPMHFGSGPGLTNRPIGQRGGAEQVTLTVGTMPSHNHTLELATTDGPPPDTYVVVPNYSSTANATLDEELGMTGGGQAHDNMPPFQVLNFCIALVGVFPSRN